MTFASIYGMSFKTHFVTGHRHRFVWNMFLLKKCGLAVANLEENRAVRNQTEFDICFFLAFCILLDLQDFFSFSNHKIRIIRSLILKLCHLHIF